MVAHYKSPRKVRCGRRAHELNASKVGVVFSSGFFGFFAHAGFLAALRDLEITPSGYGGASSGAIIAAMAASEMSDHAIAEMLFNLKKADFWDPDPKLSILKSAFKLFRGYTGLLRGEGFANLLEALPIKRIEDCPRPLVITATNLTAQREEIFTRGALIKAVQASGAMPMLFKPVELDGHLFVDGGIVNKAPVLALADLIQPETIIVHFITSDNLVGGENILLRKTLTLWRINRLAVNISRQEAYRRQCDLVRERGIRVFEIRTDAPSVGPNSLQKGPLVYEHAREAARGILSIVRKEFRS
ncbi:MAG: patatin-like phospholipase family protein [Deltaproteobacteria bacterium]|nr:MAG: patatin-like phospholipase family protein [Deltaproteobacteria bacterium]